MGPGHQAEPAEDAALDDRALDRPIPERREKISAPRQDLPAGVGERVYCFGERVGPEIQETASQIEVSNVRQEDNSYTKGGVCTAAPADPKQ